MVRILHLVPKRDRSKQNCDYNEITYISPDGTQLHVPKNVAVLVESEDFLVWISRFFLPLNNDGYEEITLNNSQKSVTVTKSDYVFFKEKSHEAIEVLQ